VTRVPIEVKGVEFAGELRPHEDWTITATYATTRGKTAIAEGAPLDLDLGARSQGPDKFVAAVRWAITPAINVRLQAEHYAARDINEGRDNLEEHFSGYTLAHLGMGWATKWGEFGFGIENLFDRSYVGYYSESIANNNVDPTRSEDYFAGHGRTYTLSWRRTFE
jgi:iron complex outermembrane recepter protein